MLPETVTGYAAALLDKQPPTHGAHRALVECSSRYSMGRLFELARGFAESRIVSVPVVYPWWENAARVTEMQAAALQIAWLVLSVIPAVGLCVIAVRLWKGRRLHFADIPEYYERLQAWFAENRRSRLEKRTESGERRLFRKGKHEKS